MSEEALRRYDILNSITSPQYKTKFPYDIILNSSKPRLELTHKKIELEFIKNKNYFVTSDQAPKWKKGGIYGGSSKIMVYFL